MQAGARYVGRKRNATESFRVIMVLMPKFFTRRTRIVLLLATLVTGIGLALRQAGPVLDRALPKAADGPHEKAVAGAGNKPSARPQTGQWSGEPVKQGGRSAEERRQALLEAAQHADGRAAELLLAAAIRDADASVRREALAWSASVGEPAVDKLVLEVALQDPDPELRDLAFHRVNELPVRVRVDLFAGALHGANNETAIKAAQWLAVLGGKSAAQALVSAWQRVVAADRAEAVRKALERLTGRRFASANEARDWWSNNTANLDEELQPVAR